MWLVAIVTTHGQGAGAMLIAALSLSVFMVIAGIGQVFVITLGPGNIDLSLSANIGLASAVAMTVMNGADSSIALGLLAALACGLAAGAGNYLLIRGLRIPPIIATLSASFILQSIDISFGRGLQIKPPAGFAAFTNLQFAGMPLLAALVAMVTVAAGVLLHRTIYGRSVLAVGQNARAARLAGIKVERTRALTYCLSGLLGGLDGALLAGYFGGASVDIGNEYLLLSVAIVVLGGTSVAGGKAQVPGLWGAALFLTLLLTVLDAFGLGAGLRMVLTGAAIVAVIIIAGGTRSPAA
jgi:ribose transport system permease protein